MKTYLVTTISSNQRDDLKSCVVLSESLVRPLERAIA